MIPIAVCDDLPRDREMICAMLRELLPEAQIRAFSEAGELLAAVEEGWPAVIAVLDIQMERTDGIRLAEQLLRLCPGCRIIFITEYLAYAPDVYSVPHSYFVLKSQMRSRMPDAVRRALEEVTCLLRLSFSHGGQLHALTAESVLYLERRLRTTYLYSDSGRYETAEHARQILQRSGTDLFCQCHHSFWVNLSRVSTMSADCFLMNDGTEVPISRRFRSAVKTQFFAALHREIEFSAMQVL